MKPTRYFVTIASFALFTAWTVDAVGETPRTTRAPGFRAASATHGEMLMRVPPKKHRMPRSLYRCAKPNLYTSKRPAMTLEVTESVRARLRITGSVAKERSYFILLPGKKVQCFSLDNDRVITRRWDPGTYEIFFVAFGTKGYRERRFRGIEVPASTYRVELTDLTPKELELGAISPNPKPLPPFLTDARHTSARDLGASCDNTRGFASGMTTEQPAAVVNLQRPMAKLRVWVETGTRDVLVTDASGRSKCSSMQTPKAFVQLSDVPAGALEIRAAGPKGSGRDDAARSHPDGAEFFSVSIEDYSVARDPVWTKATPRVAVTKGLEQALLTNGLTQESLTESPRGRDCRGFRFASAPDVVLDVDRPRDDVFYRLLATAAPRLWIDGPYDDEFRETSDYESRCMDGGPGDKRSIGRLEMGRYRVRIGVKSESDRATYVLVLGDSATTEEPAKLVGVPPKDLAIGARSILPYFPMLPLRANEHRLWGNVDIVLRQALVLTAPTQLFVYPKFDLDSASARFVGARELKRAKVEVEYPTKGEPMLVLRDVGRSDRNLELLSVDGGIYRVSSKYIAGSTDAAVFPKRVRNVVLDWEHATKLASGKDEKAVARVQRKKEKAEACYYTYWDKHHGGASDGDLLRVTYVNGEVQRVEDYGEVVDKKARRRCKLGAAAKAQAKVFKRLDRSFRKRAAKTIGEVAARFAEEDAANAN